MAESRDRTDHYIPEGLYSGEGRPVEIHRGQWDGERYAEPIIGPMKHGLPDELNRDGSWTWVQVGPNQFDPGEHWSRFEGHIIQVDVELHTHNWRDVNDWKGKDEVRAATEWSIKLNRIPVYSGGYGKDVLETLLIIRSTLQKLLNHSVMHKWTQDEIDSLVGRRVKWRGTPAVITRTALEHEGRIILEREGGGKFPPPPWANEEGDENDYDDSEDETIIADILSTDIWWWR